MHSTISARLLDPQKKEEWTHKRLRELDSERHNLLGELADHGAGRVGEGVEVDLGLQLEELCVKAKVRASRQDWSADEHGRAGELDAPWRMRPRLGSMRSRTFSYRTSSGRAMAAWMRTGSSESVMQLMRQLSVFSRACAQGRGVNSALAQSLR